MANTKIQSEQIEDDIALGGNPTTTTQSAGNNTTRVATTAFVTTAVANLVDSAPSALDTLNELAAAMGDDASFSTTITNSIATKLPLAGGTMTGNIAHASDFTLDVGGSITLDSDSGVIDFDDGGTNIGRIENASSDFKLESRVQDKDIVLIGNDGGVGVEALRLDMSAAGNVQARRARSNTAGEVALSVQPSDSVIHYGFRIDSNTNSFNLDRVDSAGQLVRVTTSGNVGIGVTPSASHYKTLEIGTVGCAITGRGAADTHILSGMYWDGASTRKYAVSGVAVGTYQITNGAHYWSSPAAGTAGNTATVSANMTLDASGNLGIGTSPSFTFHVSSTDSIVGVVDSDNDSGTYLYIRNSDATTGRTANLGFAPANNIEGARVVAEAIEDFSTSANRTADLAFQVRHNGTMAERWRIHSDGPLVSQAQTPVHISGTPADANFTEIGSGYINLARDDTADADQILFAKNGVIHTRLKTINGAFVIDSASGNVHVTANSNSLNYNGSTLKPFDSDDNLIDLGTSSARYKDLYLSGGVFLGGTGSANELDDYEEGAWTPTIESTGTASFSGAKYTKVGRLVTCNFYVINIGNTTASTAFSVSLPFTAATNDKAAPVSFMGVDIDIGQITAAYIGGTTTAQFYQVSSSTAYQILRHSNFGANTAFYAAFTYMAV